MYNSVKIARSVSVFVSTIADGIAVKTEKTHAIVKNMDEIALVSDEFLRDSCLD